MLADAVLGGSHVFTLQGRRRVRGAPRCARLIRRRRNGADGGAQDDQGRMRGLCPVEGVHGGWPDHRPEAGRYSAGVLAALPGMGRGPHAALLLGLCAHEPDRTLRRSLPGTLLRHRGQNLCRHTGPGPAHHHHRRRGPRGAHLRRPGPPAPGGQAEFRPRRQLGRGQRGHQRHRHRAGHGKAHAGLRRRTLLPQPPRVELHRRSHHRPQGRNMGLLRHLRPNRSRPLKILRAGAKRHPRG